MTHLWRRRVFTGSFHRWPLRVSHYLSPLRTLIRRWYEHLGWYKGLGRNELLRRLHEGLMRRLQEVLLQRLRDELLLREGLLRDGLLR